MFCDWLIMTMTKDVIGLHKQKEYCFCFVLQKIHSIAYSFVIVIINQSQNIFLELRADPANAPLWGNKIQANIEIFPTLGHNELSNPHGIK